MIILSFYWFIYLIFK